MAKIHRVTDRVRIKIDDVEVVVSPLNYLHKMEIQGEMLKMMSDKASLIRAMFKAIKYSVKEIHGVEDSDGKPYECEHEASGVLTDECVGDLLTMECSDKLNAVCVALVNKFPKDKVLDGEGKEIEGVELVSTKQVPPLGKDKRRK